LYTLTAKTGAGKTALLIIMALAVVTGRGEIIGREVAKGRVAFVAVENPDDLRMKLMVAAYILNINFAEIAGNLIILDKRVSPEAWLQSLKSFLLMEISGSSWSTPRRLLRWRRHQQQRSGRQFHAPA
jgi:hypothetical protein